MPDISIVKSRIKEIIRASVQINSADIDETADLHRDLGIDSLTLLEVALSIDEEFKTDFTEEELLTMASIQRAAEMVMDRLAPERVSQSV